MTGLLLILVVAVVVALVDTRRRLGRIERRVAALGTADAAPIPAAEATTPIVHRRPPMLKPRIARSRVDLESLIGGRLPIWIGGIALVLAGFFLVRAVIDSGWFGPGVRVALAALLAMVLAAGSEVARRLPATRDDARIGQVLAGAGIASAYGTLYLAAALYHLIAPLGAFVLLLLITAIGLALAMRHGPPTAIMALAGGFLAPLVAGYDAAGVAPLVIYLALLLGALFALSVRRGWSWLAAASAAAGFGWTGFLTLALDGGDRPIVGGFVVALALAATIALPASGTRSLPLRIAPMALGLAQLFALAPILDFSTLAWGFYLVLAGASVALAWRDARLILATLIAALLILVLLMLAPANSATGLAGVLATALFGGAGLARSRTGRGWAVLAATGLAGPLIVLQLGTPQLLPRPLWAVAALLVAGAGLWQAWRHRTPDEGRDAGLVGGALATAAAGVLAVIAIAGDGAVGVALAVAILAIAEAARRSGSAPLATAAALPLAVGLLAAHAPLGDLLATLAISLPGEELTYRQLPPLADLLRLVVPLALAGLWPLRFADGYGRVRRIAGIAAGLLAVASAYALLKQPLAITDAARFAAWGFIERAVITLAALIAASALVRRAPRAATALAIAALARIAWFDLFLLSPVFAPQAVGSIPVLNAAVALPAIAAALAWRWPGGRFRPAALALMLVAALALVRQAAHGTILTGPVGTGENWGYSAVMLLLALGWLWRGLAGGARDLRFAGLGLAMLVALKVFTIDVALEGLLRVVSLLGIGVTLIAISWAYTRFLKRDPAGDHGSP
ncbi:DUF2339 domain-containing protein [Sphingomonas sp.]|uniref:DUF2339 domain-containing protein n=1 Tax=Sphingomonas sp. TaxID=28214 RepID=UPI002C5F96A4|nr:DUF2339 domain-containing protein [Sphingomonas sp.]HTG39409.1 DUF2339 domain-containing protein [Sphingomonas sp.]